MTDDLRAYLDKRPWHRVFKCNVPVPFHDEAGDIFEFRPCSKGGHRIFLCTKDFTISNKLPRGGRTRVLQPRLRVIESWIVVCTKHDINVCTKHDINEPDLGKLSKINGFSGPKNKISYDSFQEVDTKNLSHEEILNMYERMQVSRIFNNLTMKPNIGPEFWERVYQKALDLYKVYSVVGE